jgi:hypothetical protein
MHSLIEEDLARVRQIEIQAALPAQSARDVPHRSVGEQIVIRRSAPGDGSALCALAALDDRDWAGGPALVAEVDGALEAALPLDGSGSFADPFAATAEVVALLELRAAQLGLAKRARRWALAR